MYGLYLYTSLKYDIDILDLSKNSLGI